MRRSAPEAEDPVGARSAFLFGAFGWYLRWLFWRRFNAVRVSREGLPRAAEGRPLIVCSNHPSWWDPALFIMLQTILLPGRTGYGPMDAAALRKYGLLRRMGVFGIALDSRAGAVRFLDVSARILEDKAAVLWVTAQGAFADGRSRPIRLRPGVAHLLRRVPDAVVVPLAMEYVFWNEAKPEALARFGPPMAAGRQLSAAEWTAALEGALTETADRLAAESQARDPRRFVRVMRGNAAVGPVYAAYRRLRAALTGQAMDVTHGGRE